MQKSRTQGAWASSGSEPNSVVEFLEPQQQYLQQAMPLLPALEEHEFLHVVCVLRELVAQLFLRSKMEGESGQCGTLHRHYQIFNNSWYVTKNLQMQC